MLSLKIYQTIYINENTTHFYIEKSSVAFTSNRRSQKIYSFAMLSEKFGDSRNFKLPAHWYLLTAVWSLESIRITCTVWILGAVYAMDMAIPKRHRYFVCRVVQPPPIMISVLNITPMAQYLISMVARIVLNLSSHLSPCLRWEYSATVIDPPWPEEAVAQPEGIDLFPT